MLKKTSLILLSFHFRWLIFTSLLLNRLHKTVLTLAVVGNKPDRGQRERAERCITECIMFARREYVSNIYTQNIQFYRKENDKHMARPNSRTSAPPNPMVDNAKIESTIIEKGYSLSEFAKMIGLCYHTLRSRLDDGRWTVKEAWEVSKILDIPLNTFFAYPERLREVA